MIKITYSLRIVIFGLGIFLSGFWATASLAEPQVPAIPQPDLTVPTDANIDDLPDFPQQMETWSCSQGGQSALVEVKDVKNWSETMSEGGWECRQNLSSVPDDSPQFSCESNETPINIITLTWLAGEGGKQQMKTWMAAFQNRGMTCTTDETNPFWE